MDNFIEQALIFIEQEDLGELGNLIDYYANQLEEREYPFFNFSENINLIFENVYEIFLNDESRQDIIIWLDELINDTQTHNIKIKDATVKKFRAKVKSLSSEEGYAADDETIINKKYRKRLLLGEGNFSYSKALIKKHKNTHPNLAQAITATEYESKEKLLEGKDGELIKKNIAFIKAKQGKVKFNVDATNISEKLVDEKFQRIHFNNPYAPGWDGTKNVVSGFFQSAKEMQDKGDRVHMSLVDKQGSKAHWHEQIYGIFDASADAGYKLLKKRKFGDKRYPGYEHRVTTNLNTGKSSSTAKFSKEFVFEKCNLTQSEIEQESKNRGILRTFEDKKYFDISTDDDSSDYLTDESTFKI